MLATELTGATFVEADSPVELRFRPKRLTDAIEDFLGMVFAAPEIDRMGGPR